MRVVVWTVLFVVAGYVGRATIIDAGSLSLVWPAAGVAVLFLATCFDVRWVVLACLGVATFVVNRTTGASDALGAVFVVTNLAQVVLFVHLGRRWLSRVWGFGGTEPLDRLGDLGRLTLISVSSGLLGASLGSVGLLLVNGAAPWSAFVTWWGRNAVGSLVIVALGLLTGPMVQRARDLAGLRGVLRRAVVPRSSWHAEEAVALVTFSALLYWLIFFRAGGQPLSFLLLIPAVWAGIRFSPPSVAIHGIVTGGAAIALTMTSRGMFVGIERTDLRAVVVQVFAAMAMLTGLALAFSRAELARARRSEAERAALLAAVLETMSEGVVVVDGGEHPVVENPAHRLMLKGALEWTYRDGSMVPPDAMPQVRALQGDFAVGEDYVLTREQSGESHTVEITVHPMPHAHTDGPRVMMMIRDVTLDRSDRDSLARFAGVVAHDLQNPLTIIGTWTQMVRTELVNGPAPSDLLLPMLQRIESAVEHMSRFIGDLLAYTVARDQPLRLGDVDVAAVSRDVARLHQDRPSAPVFSAERMPNVWADERLIRQLLDNLVGNAVKYVAPGIQPVISLAACEIRPGWLEMRLTDNGIGIAASDRDRVFQALQRAQGGMSYRGTGLGLAICRNVVNRHGGEIHAESAPAGGTVIVFTLPQTSDAYSEGVSRTA